MNIVTPGRPAISKSETDESLPAGAEQGRASPVSHGSNVNTEHVLEQVSSALSHDIRTPLRHMKHFLDFFERSLKEPLSDEAREHLEIVKESLEETADMVDELVAFGREHQKRPAREVFSVSEIAQLAVGRLKDLWPERDITLELVGNALIDANPVRTHALLFHLFENAALHSDKGAVQLLVSFREMKGERVRVIIDDNGPGLRLSEDSAFRLFQKLSTESDRQGVGAGLPMARRLAEVQGGELHLSPETSASGGARFLLDLPGGLAD